MEDKRNAGTATGRVGVQVREWRGEEGKFCEGRKEEKEGDA